MQNYEIIKNGSFSDYGKGFEIQSPIKEFILWDITYDQLGLNKNLLLEAIPHRLRVCKFKYPVRIGNILMKDFCYYPDNERKDVAILGFFCRCYDETSTDASYNEIKDLLLRDFGNENKVSEYERQDQKSCGFKAKGMLFNIVYTYGNDKQFIRRYSSFAIENLREYPQLLIDLEYEELMEVTSWIVLPLNINTSHDYKRIERIKRRPNKLPNNGLPIIWLDDKNNKIGFADDRHCQMFDKFEIESFTIQNILPAKGPGGGYLEISFKDNRDKYTILSGRCYDFDPFKKKISKLTMKEVLLGPEYHDS
jgi:hypothetical protein